MRLLIAEDERDLNMVLTNRMKSEGYSVDSCYDGESALDAAIAVEYDAIILDIAMPKMDGLEALREMRRRKIDSPVIMLTARDAISDRVKGFEDGADDYLIKPFDFDELLARVKALFRRRSNSTSNVFKVADLVVDCDRVMVTRGTDEITLSAKEFSLLEYMIRNRGVVLSREKIVNHIWNFDYEGGSNVIDVYIRYLRKKIDENHSVKLIHTIRGRGYVLKDGEVE